MLMGRGSQGEGGRRVELSLLLFLFWFYDFYDLFCSSFRLYLGVFAFLALLGRGRKKTEM